MEFKQVNTNESSLSKLALGTVQLGLDYSIKAPKPSRGESHKIIEYALKAGIETLDTARAYGEAEQIVGDYIKNNPDQRVNVVTKFKITSLRSFEQARAEAYHSVNASISALKIKCIPVCLFHMDKGQPMQLVMKILPRILQELEEEGLIETGGISVFSPDQAYHTLDYDVIQAIQAPMNIFDQRLKQKGTLQRLHAQRKKIFIRSVFLKGLFFMSPENLPKSLAEAGEYLKILDELANDIGMSAAQVAFSYIRDMKEVTSIVFGADSVEQVRQNIQFLQSKELGKITCEKIEKEFQDLPEAIISPYLWYLK